ncbi:MAG: FCD domain-containing protein, partial [Cellulomonas sp.]
VSSQRRVGLVVLPETSWDVMNSSVIGWRLDGRGRVQQLRSLTEFRAAVEPMAAAAASRNARREHRDHLVNLAAKLAEFGGAGDLDSFLQADIEFHSLLLTASGNEMFAAMKDVLAVALAGRVRQGLMPNHPRPESIVVHTAIAMAVANADAAAAFDGMVGLLTDLRRDLFAE